MTSVIADITMSLDGYVTGPDPDLAHGLGRDGEAIQEWVFESHSSPQDREFLEQAGKTTGAIIMGRRTFDFVDGPHGWDENIGYAYDHEPPSRPPVFVVTHRAPEHTRLVEGLSFVTGGITAAVENARRVAENRDVNIMGGAETIDRAIRAGVVDRVRIHLSPVLMGSGTRLFDHLTEQVNLTQENVIITPHATHLTYRVDR